MAPARIGIVYYSVYGHIRKMAQVKPGSGLVPGLRRALRASLSSIRGYGEHAGGMLSLPRLAVAGYKSLRRAVLSAAPPRLLHRALAPQQVLDGVNSVEGCEGVLYQAGGCGA